MVMVAVQENGYGCGLIQVPIYFHDIEEKKERIQFDFDDVVSFTKI
jgi:hypothetical protein